MVDIKEFINDWRKRRAESRRERIHQGAREVFQVTEHDNQLWFMCNNVLLCPCSLVCEDKDTAIVSFLTTLRNLYIDRHFKNKKKND